MITKATTTTGAVYLLVSDSRRLVKIKHGRIVGGNYDSILNSKVSDHLLGSEEFRLPWNEPSLWVGSLPVVGKTYYVSTRNEWWITTPIVSVENISEDEANKLVKDSR